MDAKFIANTIGGNIASGLSLFALAQVVPIYDCLKLLGKSLKIP
jgi:hypothetical protein